MARMKKKEFGRPASKPGIYKGTKVADGNGNLVATEGPQKGEFIAWEADETEEGHYVFVMPGEPSHNERYHKQFVGVEVGEEGSLESGGN